LICVVGENEEDLFAGKKKKAKKILVNAGEGGGDSANASTSAAAPTEEGDDLDFSNLKKKKKKRVIDSDVAAFEAKLEEAGVVDDKEADVEGEDPFSKAEGDEVMVEGEQDEEEAWLKSDRDYTYEEVLCPS
jgi:translation initiation factor 2 subunit 2